MKTWSLNLKIFSVVSGLIIIGALTNWLGVNRLGTVQSSLDHILSSNVGRIEAAHEIENSFKDVAIAFRDQLLDFERTGGTNHEIHQKKVMKELAEVQKDIELALKIATQPEEKRILGDLQKNMAVYVGHIEHLQKLLAAKDGKAALALMNGEAVQSRMSANQLADEFLKFNRDRLTVKNQEAQQIYTQSRNLMVLLSLIAAVGGLSISYLVLRALTRAINRIIENLSLASDQVAQSSEQIAQASEELSSATNEQAASLQETSSSIEELTSMVQKNSDNAKHAAESAQKSLDSAEGGKGTIEEMVRSIKELEESNQQIAEIVKVFGEIQQKTQVIEEIVFQTQLLSFNASVEAARAGEHGKGFAVVAEEVGNLAEMSGSASNEIGSLLSGSLKKVETTVKDVQARIEKLVDQTGRGITALDQIVQEAKAASALTGEIASASDEQSRGIGEINRAMGQLDQSTQQNAATSEQAASSSEELSTQAVAMRSTVQDLIDVIKGSGGAEGNAAVTSAPSPSAKIIPIKSARKGGTVVKTPRLKKAVGAENVPSADDPGFQDL